MKKSVLIALISSVLLTSVCFSAFADKKSDTATAEQVYKNEFVESTISYRNVWVYKVLDAKEAYIVMYAKGHREVGSITIPKKWYKESPKKLSFRNLSKGMTPYMTVLYREGNFDKVILTMPLSRGNSYWGVADSNAQVDADKDTLDIVY